MASSNFNDTTIIVTPRERFSFAVAALEIMLARTPLDVPIVYVDTGSPEVTSAQIGELLATRSGTHLRSEEFLMASAARNLGARHADPEARFLVFIENDVVVEPGWLEHLRNCAIETGAGVVGPLFQEGDPATPTIHNGGGLYREINTSNGRLAFERHLYARLPYVPFAEGLLRGPTDYVEGHCMLVHRKAFDLCDGFDERLLTQTEYLDLCLRVREHGLDVYVEPKSVVTYKFDDHLTLSDLEVFLPRWSIDAARQTIDHFAKLRGLRLDCEFLANSRNFVRYHRGRISLYDSDGEWLRSDASVVPSPEGESWTDVISYTAALGYGFTSIPEIQAFGPHLSRIVDQLGDEARGPLALGCRAAACLAADHANVSLLVAAVLFALRRLDPGYRIMNANLDAYRKRGYNIGRVVSLIDRMAAISNKLGQKMKIDPTVVDVISVKALAALAALGSKGDQGQVYQDSIGHVLKVIQFEHTGAAYRGAFLSGANAAPPLQGRELSGIGCDRL